MSDKERPFFQGIKDKNRRSLISILFARNNSQNDSGLVMSFNISLLVAKCGKLFRIEDKFVFPAI